MVAVDWVGYIDEYMEPRPEHKERSGISTSGPAHLTKLAETYNTPILIFAQDLTPHGLPARLQQCFAQPVERFPRM
jgi:hypothetical protein